MIYTYFCGLFKFLCFLVFLFYIFPRCCFFSLSLFFNDIISSYTFSVLGCLLLRNRFRSLCFPYRFDFVFFFSEDTNYSSFVFAIAVPYTNIDIYNALVLRLHYILLFLFINFRGVVLLACLLLLFLLQLGFLYWLSFFFLVVVFFFNFKTIVALRTKLYKNIVCHCSCFF